MKPRYYQSDAVNGFFDFFANGGIGNPLIAMPTGTGKSLVMALLIMEICRRYRGQRILMATHVKELIEQNYKTLLKVWPSAPAGIYSAGLERKDVGFPITYAGIGSIHKKAHVFQKIDVMLIDEAHLISPKSSTMYRKFIEDLKRYNPYLVIVGLTATPFRTGQGMLTNVYHGQDPLFTHFCYDITGVEAFNRLLYEGFLCTLIPQKTKTELDVDGLKIVNGDFSVAEMQERYNLDKIIIEALEEAIVRGYDRKHWLIFATGVEHCDRIAKLLNEKYNIPTVAVHSKLPSKDRDANFKAFVTGQVRACVNNNCMTVGVDYPDIDCMIVLRPTNSPGLWVQLLGRGLRPVWPNSDRSNWHLWPQGYVENGRYSDMEDIAVRQLCIKEGPKVNCIASGQKVLTDFGLVPIEKITREMKVWDGLDFVSHDGVIYQGEHETIEYAGLIATPDHRIKTEKGWQTFGDCSTQQNRIVITGNGKHTIRESENYFTTYNKRTSKKKSLCFNRMSNLWHSTIKRTNKCNQRKSWLSGMWEKDIQTKNSSTMVIQSLLCSFFKMFKSIRRKLFGLWRKGNKVFIRVSFENGGLDARELRFTSGYVFRSNKQRRTLRSWKYEICNSSSKCIEQQNSKQYKSESFSPKLSRNSLRRFNLAKFLFKGFFRQTNNRKILSEIRQTKRHTWDILNCGPRNSFTCEGLLVHNCLVLDFAANTKRLGPINDPIIPYPKTKKGATPRTAPIKICDNCGMYCHASVRICGNCQYEFPRVIKIMSESSNDELIRTQEMRIEVLKVKQVGYYPHNKIGKPEQIKVSYQVGMLSFDKWIQLEHPEPMAHKAREFWRKATAFKDLELPTTTAEALTRTNELMFPSHIRVRLDTPYPQILDVDYTGTAFGSEENNDPF